MRIWLARDFEKGYGDKACIFKTKPENHDGIWIGNLHGFLDFAFIRENLGLKLSLGELVEAELKIELLPQCTEITRTVKKKAKKHDRQ